MATPLNLTLKRGPSIWEDQTTSPSRYWRTYGVAAGAMIAAMALQPRANRSWLLGLALGVAGMSLLAGRFSSTIGEAVRQINRLGTASKDHVVDRALEDSFPASDPPQYV